MSESKSSMILNGVCKWAHIVNPEKWDGNPIGYSIMVKLENEEKLEKLKNYLEEFWEENKGTIDKKLNAKKSPTLPFKEDDEEGVEYVKARTSHVYKNRKTGEETPKKLPVFKSNGIPLEEGVLVGNGSVVQVNVTPAVYAVNSTNFGVKLYLNAVRVVDLKEYHKEASAESYGFDVTTDESEGEDVEF